MLCEVGPRDGFQYEEREIPTSLKVEIIRKLTAAGLRRLQVASFVHPRWVPQMADAEKVVEAVLPAPEGVEYAGLALNLRGVERAAAAGLPNVDISIATHERHSLDNANMTVEEAVREAEAMIDHAHALGLRVQMGLQTVFGYEEPGDTPLANVVDLCEMMVQWGVDEISLADSTGMANPVRIREYVAAVREQIGSIPLVLHLHDTRGLGLANVYAALQEGVDRFDTSFGGLGGCPFIRGATGNIATEDTAYMLEEMGIATGVNVGRVAACSIQMEEHLGHELPGKLHRLAARSDVN